MDDSTSVGHMSNHSLFFFCYEEYANIGKNQIGYLVVQSETFPRYIENMKSDQMTKQQR